MCASGLILDFYFGRMRKKWVQYFFKNGTHTSYLKQMGNTCTKRTLVWMSLKIVEVTSRDNKLYLEIDLRSCEIVWVIYNSMSVNKSLVNTQVEEAIFSSRLNFSWPRSISWEKFRCGSREGALGPAPPRPPILRPKFLPLPRLRCAMSAKISLGPPLHKSWIRTWNWR